MSKFKVGDLVVRVKGHANSSYDAHFVDGMPYEVSRVVSDTIYIKGMHYPYDEGYFKLADNSTKPSNPKDAIGETKLDYSVIPNTALAYLSIAFFEGAAKYGKLNWRHAGVRASVYTNALERHLQKYIGGEFVDPETGVPHLASVMACAGIILDAGVHGKLTDDRPDESKESVALIPECAAIQQKLKALHKDKNPIHYTKDRNVTK